MKQRWENVYKTKRAESLSWFQPRAERSLRLIRETGLGFSASIIDVGGGASRLVDELLEAGYRKLTVLDISAAALAVAKARLGERGNTVNWVEGDITQLTLPANAYDIWHDRATFHFLTNPQDRRAYVANVLRTVKPGWFAIIATFGEDGPTQCTGLPVVRYSPDLLQAEFGSAFNFLKHEQEHEQEEHRTPAGAVQKFVYCCFQKKPTALEAELSREGDRQQQKSLVVVF
ncbi:class I SAM-dependent methyltransferase [Synechococcus sp. W65.1]|uniref:class I SAM-dependent methyltransferase n=1 Tax=Synechococcus sp. W65.1 TaxID=2964526 RepID=UPI0039C1DA35